MKKVILIGVSVLFILFIASWGYFRLDQEKKGDLETASVSLAGVVVDFYRGVERHEDFIAENKKYLDDSVVEKLRAYLEELKQLDNQKFNVTEYYNENYLPRFDVEDVDAAPVVEDEEYVPVDDTDNMSSDFQQDKRIFTEDGVDYIWAKDFSFNEEGIDVVSYKGIHMLVSKEEVPVTYEQMKKDPSKVYRYATHKSIFSKTESFTDVQFASVVGQDTLIVRVFYKKGKIVDFVVR